MNERARGRREDLVESPLGVGSSFIVSSLPSQAVSPGWRVRVDSFTGVIAPNTQLVFRVCARIIQVLNSRITRHSCGRNVRQQGAEFTLGRHTARFLTYAHAHASYKSQLADHTPLLPTYCPAEGSRVHSWQTPTPRAPCASRHPKEPSTRENVDQLVRLGLPPPLLGWLHSFFRVSS